MTETMDDGSGETVQLPSGAEIPKEVAHGLPENVREILEISDEPTDETDDDQSAN